MSEAEFFSDGELMGQPPEVRARIVANLAAANEADSRADLNAAKANLATALAAVVAVGGVVGALYVLWSF